MRIQVKFKPLPLASLVELRREYLDGLPHAQEVLLETQVPEACCVGILNRSAELCGYLLINSEGVLFEFHLRRKYEVFGEQVLGKALLELGIERAWVKSFDPLLLSSAVGFLRQVRVIGLLVRDYVPRPLPELHGIQFSIRRALPEDLPAIADLDQQVFTNPQRLRAALQREALWVFEHVEGLIGLGVTQRVRPEHPETDVGIAVDRAYRNRGYAVYILRDLVEGCLAAGLRPIAGCRVENLASRHMGERIGFVARHRLLEIQFA